MVACLSIPGFSLRAPLLGRPELKGKPVALAPVPGTRPLLGSCTRAAQEAGVRPGMRLSEALATCPQLELVEQDPAGVEEAWEAVLRRLEGIGADPRPALVWRAALEAVTERAVELRAQIESVAGPSRRLVLAGGWARNPAARSVKRAMLGPFDWPQVTQAGARGAALLAGIAAGRFAGIDDLPDPGRRPAAGRLEPERSPR